MIRNILFVFVLIALIIIAVVGRFLFSNTPFDEKAKYLYVRTGSATRDDVMRSVREEKLVRNPRSFEFLASQMHVWKTLRPGKYEIRKGMGLFEIARMLRNGKQAPVNLVITKLRVKEHLASLVGKRFERSR